MTRPLICAAAAALLVAPTFGDAVAALTDTRDVYFTEVEGGKATLMMDILRLAR